MKQIVKESIDILRKCGYIVETMNNIGNTDDDIDGDSYNGSGIRVTPTNRYHGKDYNDWFATVKDSVWDCCCGYDISVEEFEEFMANHEDDISDAWIVKKLPKAFGRELFGKYSDEFGV